MPVILLLLPHALKLAIQLTLGNPLLHQLLKLLNLLLYLSGRLKRHSIHDLFALYNV